MEIYVICQDKSVLFDGFIKLLVYDHIETDYNKALKIIEKSKDNLYPLKIIKEKINEI